MQEPRRKKGPLIQAPLTRLLLAHDAKRCGDLYHKVRYLLEEFKHSAPTYCFDHPYAHPLAFCAVGDGCLLSIFAYLKIAKVYDSHYGLLYKLGRSRAIGPNYQGKDD